MSRLHELSGFDQKMYNEAYKVAVKSLECNEVPVGCVFVYDGMIIGRGHNDVNRMANPTLHAEMKAVEEVTRWCQENQKDARTVFSESDVYVNLEPCCMCSSALYQLKVKRVVFGAPNERFGGMGSVMSNEDFKHEAQIEVIRNVDMDRSIQLLRDFYKQENPFAPEEKRKTRNKLAAKEELSK
ncbi:unnamed protein product [Bursaphelenchus xylophilus]|uniref:(pine wood nematode) hypothetical protein n=1 Tax=Bursaphelenchus xylophilus TaxID=6326 RepID=A0A1I7RNC6_BURXY|nr:unnamed protein product [Bursaphelenchus xylophilus]CAG9123878.1 unnamed protein product [Bursaphelenchus xylophilus]